jgi:hypothetical protein
VETRDDAAAGHVVGVLWATANHGLSVRELRAATRRLSPAIGWALTAVRRPRNGDGMA